MTISGKKITQKWFLFDGCHKFYLIDSNKLTDELRGYGYEEKDIYPIDELPYKFWKSCNLRFIEILPNFKTIVPQCRKVVTFKGFGKFAYTSKMNFITNKVYTDENAAPYGYTADIIFRRMI